MNIREGIEMSDEDAKEYDRLKNEIAYYNRLQNIKKLSLNS